MTKFLNELKESQLNPLLVAVYLAAPYFYIRPYGFDFSRGTSLSLVDLFLFMLTFFVMYLFYQERERLLRSIKQSSVNNHFFSKSGLAGFLMAGAFFVFWCALSSFLGGTFYQFEKPFSLYSFFSGCSQYAFIMLLFPVFASVFLGKSSQQLMSMKLIPLGYLPAMLINLALSPHSSSDTWRSMFFSSRRAIGTYGNANSFADVILIVLPFYIYLMQKKNITLFWRVVGYIGLMTSFLCLMLTGSFGGTLIFVLLFLANIFLVITWDKHPARKDKLVLPAIIVKSVGLFALGTLLLTIYYSPVMKDVKQRFHPIIEIAQSVLPNVSFVDEVNAGQPSNDLGSMKQRLGLINSALEILANRDGGIFIGHGMRQSFRVPSFIVLGHQLDVHLLYLLLWVEGGFILTLSFCLFAFLMLRQVGLILAARPAEAIALGTSVLALILVGGVNPHLYLRYFWVPLLPCFSLYQAYVLPHSKHNEVQR